MLARRFPEFALRQEFKPADPEGERFAAAHALMPPEQHANINAAILDDLLEEIPLDVAQKALIERAKRGNGA